jgi:hypothetical protein
MIERRRKNVVFLFLTIFALAGCEDNPQQWIDPLIGPTVPVATWSIGNPTPSMPLLNTYAAVQGSVVDQDGNAVENALITITIMTPNVPLAPIPVITTKQGTYTSQGLEPAEYEIKIDMPGYEPEIQRITLIAGQQTRIDFMLKRSNI